LPIGATTGEIATEAGVTVSVASLSIAMMLGTAGGTAGGRNETGTTALVAGAASTIGSIEDATASAIALVIAEAIRNLTSAFDETTGDFATGTEGLTPAK
jgi:hypothetical protein